MTKTTIPADAKRPQDRLPAQAEAAGDAGTTSFVFRGAEYTVANDCLDDLDVMESFEDGRYISGIRTVLGDEQYAAFKAKIKAESADGRIRLTADLEPFIEEMFSSVNPTV